MYAAIRRYDGLGPGAAEETFRRVQEGVVPIISQERGFVAYYALAPDEGTVVTVSVFADQAGADESIRRGAERVKSALADLLPQPPQVTTGEVRAHHSA